MSSRCDVNLNETVSFRNGKISLSHLRVCVCGVLQLSLDMLRRNWAVLPVSTHTPHTTHTFLLNAPSSRKVLLLSPLLLVCSASFSSLVLAPRRPSHSDRNFFRWSRKNRIDLVCRVVGLTNFAGQKFSRQNWKPILRLAFWPYEIVSQNLPRNMVTVVTTVATLVIVVTVTQWCQCWQNSGPKDSFEGSAALQKSLAVLHFLCSFHLSHSQCVIPVFWPVKLEYGSLDCWEDVLTSKDHWKDDWSS